MNQLSFTEQELAPLKELLFGLQKQANVQNDAVVEIVAQQLGIHTGQHQFGASSIEDVMYETLKNMVDGVNIPDETFIRLVCGNESYRAALQEGPKTVTKSYPNPESPKCEFRIKLIGGEEAIASGDVNAKKAFLRKVLEDHPEFQEMLKPESTFYPGLDKNAKMKKLIEKYPEAFAGYSGDTYGVTRSTEQQKQLRKDTAQLSAENSEAARKSAEYTGIRNDFLKEVEDDSKDLKYEAEMIAAKILAVLPKATASKLEQRGLSKTEAALLYAEKYFMR